MINTIENKLTSSLISNKIQDEIMDYILGKEQEIEQLKADNNNLRSDEALNEAGRKIANLKVIIESLVWENKGIAEWRDEWSNMKAQRDTIQAYYKQMKEALEAITEGRWTLNKCERIAREALEGIK